MRDRTGSRDKRIEEDSNRSDEEEMGEPGGHAAPPVFERVAAGIAVAGIAEDPAIEVRSPRGFEPGGRGEDFRAPDDGIGA